MSSERFSDELLSAIIDGEADEESVASVSGDPVASQRLADMRTAIDLVSEEPALATPQRRQQSIAAALAAATPAPEVTSLTVEREARRSAPVATILKFAAAFLLFVVLAVPLVNTLRSGSDAAEVASSGDVDSVSDASLGATAETSNEATADSVDDGEEAMEDEAEAMEDAEEAMEDEEEAMEDEVEDAVDGDDAEDDAEGDAEGAFAPDSPTLAARLSSDPTSVPVANSIEEINELVANGSVFGEYEIDDLATAGINPRCLNDFDETIRFGVVQLDTANGDSPQLAVVAFDGDAITSVFDAEECAVLR